MSAIALGARQMERFFICPEDYLIAEVDLFFRNTWDINGNGYWIDAHSYNFYARNNYFTSHESAQASHEFQGEHTNTMNNALDNRSLGQNPYDCINRYPCDENVYPVHEAVLMHGEEYDVSIFNEHMKASINMDPSAVFFHPPPPLVLAPGYMHEDVTFFESFSGHYMPYPYGTGAFHSEWSPPPLVLAPGYMHEDVTSFESFSGHNMPYPYGTGAFHSEWSPSLGSAFYEAQRAELVDSNMLVPHSDHQRQMSVKIGARPKDSGVTGGKKMLTREKHSGNSHNYRNKNKNVKNYRASSNSTTGSSSKTHQPHGTSGNRIAQSPLGTDSSENTSIEAVTSQTQALQLCEKLPTNVPNSSVPSHTPVHVPSSSSQRAVDNQSLLPVSDGSTGSSFQVPTVFSFYNVPTETGTTFATTYNVNKLAELGNIIYSSQSSVWNSIQHVNQTSHDAATDILDGDIDSFFLNLQFGRLSKNQQPKRPLPPSDALPLREQFPRHRKLTPSGVMNRISCVHTPLAVMPSQEASALAGGTNESGAFWLPRFSGGTGTFMPNPVIYNERYYKNKLYYKLRFNKTQKDEKKRDEVEMAGANESSNRGESSRSGNSEVENFGSDSKSSSEHQPSS